MWLFFIFIYNFQTTSMTWYRAPKGEQGAHGPVCTGNNWLLNVYDSRELTNISPSWYFFMNVLDDDISLSWSWPSAVLTTARTLHVIISSCVSSWPSHSGHNSLILHFQKHFKFVMQNGPKKISNVIILSGLERRLRCS